MRKIAGALLVVLALSVCQGSRPRVVVTDKWDLNTRGESIEIIGRDRRLALKISPDGRIWEWESSPEKVVATLIANLGDVTARFQAYQQQVAAAMAPKTAAKLKPAAAPKKTSPAKGAK